MDYFNDPEFQDLIRSYLDYLMDSLVTFKVNCVERNYSEIRKFAHNLKGSGGGYGFDDLTQLGNDISSAAMRKDANKLDSLMKELEDLIMKKRTEYFN
ncbi:MAG: hypothetical protein IID16_11965 [Candidatus Marinimicrobia bacterium]|nr:hypothetical protein [Candidatus Neomarinimicrobiota bacterium]